MPRKTIAIPYAVNHGLTINQVLDNNLFTRNFPATLTGGFDTAPINIPDDLDPTDVVTVRLLVATAGNSVQAGSFVRFLLGATTVETDGSRLQNAFSLDYPAPNPWNTPDTFHVLLDNGSGFSYPANFFAHSRAVGFRLWREGAHANDTYAQAVLVLATLLFNYRRRCQLVCCG